MLDYLWRQARIMVGVNKALADLEGDTTVSYDEDKPGPKSIEQRRENIYAHEVAKRTHDVVNHPPHYTQGGVECIDAIDAALGENYQAYYIGQVMKYVWRAPLKGKLTEDLKKAQWYLNRLIERLA